MEVAIEAFGEDYWRGSSPAACGMIPAGAEGIGLLDSIDTDVPGRCGGRRNWHRERFCIVHLLRHLHRAEPQMFPASLTRQQSPDFVLRSLGSSITLAIEHTDAGSQQFQDWSDKNAKEIAEQKDDEVHIGPNGPTDFWPGDSAELAWRTDFMNAIMKKAPDTKWQNEPHGSQRCLMVYDMTESGIFIPDSAPPPWVRNSGKPPGSNP